MTKVRAKGIAATLLAVAMALGFGCSRDPASTSAAESPEIRDRLATLGPNAADSYRRVAAAMGDNFFDPLANMAATGKPNVADSTYLRNHQAIVRDLIEASKTGACQFDTDYSQGLNVLMPHLLWGRNFARVLQYDAVRVLYDQQESSAAVERLAAALRVSNHIGSEPVALAKLVALSGIDMAIQTILQSNSLITSQRDREMLINELRRVEAGPAFEFQDMLRKEAEMATLSIQRGEKVVPGADGVEIVVLADARVGTIAEVKRVLREIERAWNLPRAEQEIRRHSEQARLATAKPFVAGYDALRKRSRDTQAKIQATIKTLQTTAGT